MRKCLTVVMCVLVSLPMAVFGVVGSTSQEDLLFMEIPSVITASKVSEKLSDAPGIIKVVTKEDIQRFGGTTLLDILARVPGLMASTQFISDRSLIAVRGAQFKETNVHVLLLINGRPVREGQEGGIITEVLESFPVNIIEKIEVVKGPGSVLYGSGAFEGVINVITEKPEAGKASVAVLGGQSSASDVQGKVNYLKDDVSVVVAGQYRRRPDWETPYSYLNVVTGGVVTTTQEVQNKGYGSYAEVKYKNFKLMTSLVAHDNVFYLPDFGFLFDNGAGYGITTWEKRWADIGYTYNVSDKWDMDFNVTYTGSIIKVTDFPSFRRDSFVMVGEWANFIRPNERLGIVVGGSYNYTRGEEVFTAVEPNTELANRDQRSYCIYSQLDYWVSPEKVKVIGGAQVNKAENIDADTVPRVGVIYYPVQELNVKALFSQAFRAPSVNENYLNHPQFHGNLSLKSEKIDTMDLGITYFKDKVQLGLSYFQSSIKGLIASDRVTNPAAPFYANLGDIDQNGVELDAKYYASKEVLLLGSVLSQKNKDKNGTENMSPTPTMSGKIGVSYQSHKGATVSLFNSYQGKLDDKYKTTLNKSPEEAYNYASMHGRLNMTKLAGWNIGKEFSFLLHIDNLLDSEVWAPNWGLAPGTSIPLYTGRAIYFGVEIAL